MSTQEDKKLRKTYPKYNKKVSFHNTKFNIKCISLSEISCSILPQSVKTKQILALLYTSE